jgi:hypothetical protein
VGIPLQDQALAVRLLPVEKRGETNYEKARAPSENEQMRGNAARSEEISESSSFSTAISQAMPGFDDGR